MKVHTYEDFVSAYLVCQLVNMDVMNAALLNMFRHVKFDTDMAMHCSSRLCVWRWRTISKSYHTQSQTAMEDNKADQWEIS